MVEFVEVPYVRLAAYERDHLGMPRGWKGASLGRALGHTVPPDMLAIANE
jgi:hypothetical protein